jgi:hypothetical protein
MGNNLYAGGDLVVSEILSQEVGLKLAERGTFWNHPAITYAGSATYQGSSTIKMDFIDQGAQKMSAVASNVAVTPDAFTFTRASITLAQQRMGRSVGDLLRVLSPSGVIRDVDAFAADAAGSYGVSLSQLLITAGAGFSTDISDTAANLTWAKIREAKATLIAANANFTDGNVICVLHPVQYSDLEADAAAAGIGDAVSRSPEAQAIQQANGFLSGYRGSLFGIDFFTSTDVPTANAGADRRGFMACPSGLLWADALIPASGDTANREILVEGGRMAIEFERDASKALQNVYYQAILGCSIGQDSAGVTITSDA